MKKFVHYLDRVNGKDKDITGIFEIVKEDINFLVIDTGKNIVRLPYERIIKIKENKI